MARFSDSVSNLAGKLKLEFVEKTVLNSFKEPPKILQTVSLLVPKLFTRTMITVHAWAIVLMVVPVPMMLGHVRKPMTLTNLPFWFSNMLAEIIKLVSF